jgi:hypothetical protein
MDWADNYFIGLDWIIHQAYVQELEKEVRRLVNENLKLKRQCKQVLRLHSFLYSII